MNIVTVQGCLLAHVVNCFHARYVLAAVQCIQRTMPVLLRALLPLYHSRHVLL
jgi:hypothetical protein